MNDTPATFDLYSQLPSLPLPSLEATCARYLKTVRPLLDDAGYARAEAQAAELLAPRSVGRRLQAKLAERAAASDNWLSAWWEDVAYLSVPDPVVINVSFALIGDPDRPPQDQALRAGAVAARALQYRAAILEETLEPHAMGEVPADMTPLKRLFSTTRMPGTGKDQIVTQDPANSRNLLVIRKRRLFSFDAVDAVSRSMNAAALAEQFARIIAMADVDAPGEPVGVLTSLERPRWACVRAELVANPVNAAALDLIDRAIFVVCLDDEAPETLDDLARQAMHGAAGSRVFDKTLQIIVDRIGRVSFLAEHSPADGTHFLPMMDYASAADGVPRGEVGNLSEIVPLTWDLSAGDRHAIRKANEALQALTRNLQLGLRRFDGFGKDFIKARRISPDGLVQMAIQLAHIRLHDGPAKTYESAQTRRFRLGRTETIRSCSTEAVTFARVMDSGASAEQKVQALRAATEEHKLRTREACNGEGIDRHLLGLTLIAIEEGISPLPALFEEPVFTHGWKLSTSQVPSKHNIAPGFGPVCEDGYGVGYGIKSDHIYLNVTANHSAPRTNAPRLAAALEQALADTRGILDVAVPA